MAKFPDLTSTGMLHTQLRQRTGPTINRGKGNNNAATPWKFIRAVEKKFGPLVWDLAASYKNCKAQGGGKAGHFFSETDNALVQDWARVTQTGPGWNNPPFTNITPWARYHAEQVQRGAKTLLLVPGSIGANWYWDWVVPYADVYSVGRMVFDDCYDKHGKLITTVYPKDLILCHYEWRGTLKTGTRPEDMVEDGDGMLYRWRWQDGN